MEEVNKKLDRLFLLASVLLVVLTVLFSQFMNAQKFWQGKVVDIEIRLLDSSIDDNTKNKLDIKRKWFDSIHHKQNNYGRVFAGLMGFVFIVIAVAFPLGVWRQSVIVIQITSYIFLFTLLSLGIVGFLFASGAWRP